MIDQSSPRRFSTGRAGEREPHLGDEPPRRARAWRRSRSSRSAPRRGRRSESASRARRSTSRRSTAYVVTTRSLSPMRSSSRRERASRPCSTRTRSWGTKRFASLHPVADDRRRAHDERRRVARVLLPSREEGERHERLAEPHVVGEDAARAELAEELQPRDARSWYGRSVASSRAGQVGARRARRAREAARAGVDDALVGVTAEALDPSLDAPELMRREATAPVVVDESRALVDERAHLVVDLRSVPSESAIHRPRAASAARSRAHLDLERARPEVELGVEPAEATPTSTFTETGGPTFTRASDSATSDVDARRRRDCAPRRMPVCQRWTARSSRARPSPSSPASRRVSSREPCRANERSARSSASRSRPVDVVRVRRDAHAPRAIDGEELAAHVERRARERELERGRLERREPEDLAAAGASTPRPRPRERSARPTRLGRSMRTSGKRRHARESPRDVEVDLGGDGMEDLVRLGPEIRKRSGEEERVGRVGDESARRSRTSARRVEPRARRARCAARRARSRSEGGSSTRA